MKDVVTFSILKHDMIVDGLKLAWWMRRLANLKQEQGELYRAKGIFPTAGTKELTVFHAVQDLMDKSSLHRPNYKGKEAPCHPCKVVFIGRKLDEENLRKGFESILLKAPPKIAKVENLRQCPLVELAHNGRPMLDRIYIFLDSSGDVGRLGLTCRDMHVAVFGEDAMLGCRQVAAECGVRVVQQFQCKWVNLHALGLNMAYVKTYWEHMRKANLDVVSMKGLAIRDARDAEACGITWLEVRQ